MLAAMTSSTLQKLYAAETTRKAPKKSGHYQLISFALGAVGVACTFTDLPDSVSWGITGLGAASWLILRAVRQSCAAYGPPAPLPGPQLQARRSDQVETPMPARARAVQYRVLHHPPSCR